MKKYRCLEPATLGRLHLKNRLILPPMVTNYASAKTGAVSDQYIAYLEERARGGVGMIIMEASSVHPSGRGFLRGACIDADYLIPKLRHLTDRVHAYGTKIAIQLHHAGRETSACVTGQTLVAPSECPVAYSNERVRTLTVDDMNILADAYAQAARRAKEAGFDAVQIHGAHGYLLTEFTSPYTNKRTDEYGGSLENRFRFPLEVIKRVREAVGNDFVVTYRMTVDEGLDGGLTLEESCKMAPVLAEAGIDALHVVAGNYASGDLVIPVQASPRCSNEHRVEAIRKAVNGRIPVVVAGRIRSIDEAERLIQEGKTDFVAMGRALLCDPFLPQKAAVGDTLVRPCISCKEACESHVGKGLEIGCILNPRLGEEGVFPLDAKTTSPRKIVVVGAGPAGMEAACTAAERGHDVDLYEQAPVVGGMLHEAGKPPYKEDLNRVIGYYEERLRKSGVRVHTGVKADAATIAEVGADVLIVAAGATPFVPPVKGADTVSSCLVCDVLRGMTVCGKNVAIIGGGQAGVETAEFLAIHGHQVTVIEMQSEIAVTMEPVARGLLMKRLNDYGVNMLPGRSVSRMERDKIFVVKSDSEDLIEGIDTVVWATGFKPNEKVRDMFQNAADRVEFIGDCLQPTNIERAVHMAYHLAFSL